jgi:hypothetical protein
MWKLAGTVSVLMSNGTESKLIVSLYLCVTWKGELKWLSNFIFIFLGIIGFLLLSELDSVSYCLITVLVLIVETSSVILLFCQTFHWQGDLLFVGWCSVHSCAEWCQCKVQGYTFSYDSKAEKSLASSHTCFSAFDNNQAKWTSM